MAITAIRARKARRASRLSCGHYVLVGHLIACVNNRWVCVECLLEAREAVKEQPPCLSTTP